MTFKLLFLGLFLAASLFLYLLLKPEAQPAGLGRHGRARSLRQATLPGRRTGRTPEEEAG